ncbi:hypothetical protein C8R42DRAFT_722830 [Lentinula raphanica]|nr:hypothetical protein C8R42DRAFT_722830 [Lentinula raphanica]
MVRFDFRAIFILAVISSGALAAPTPIPRASAIELQVQDLQFSDPAIGGPLAIVNVLEPRGNVVDSSDELVRLRTERKNAIGILAKYIVDIHQAQKRLEDPRYKWLYKKFEISLTTLKTLLTDMVNWSIEDANALYLNAMLRPGEKPGDSDDRLLKLVKKIRELEAPIDGDTTGKKIEEIFEECKTMELEFSLISGRKINLGKNIIPVLRSFLPPEQYPERADLSTRINDLEKEDVEQIPEKAAAIISKALSLEQFKCLDKETSSELIGITATFHHLLWDMELWQSKTEQSARLCIAMKKPGPTSRDRCAEFEDNLHEKLLEPLSDASCKDPSGARNMVEELSKELHVMLTEYHSSMEGAGVGVAIKVVGE